MPRLSSIAILTTCLLANASIMTQVQAKAAPWYEVEVFIFEHPSQTTEQWSEDVVQPKVQGAVDFITPAITTELSVTNLGLSDNEKNTVPLCKPNDWGVSSTSSSNLASQDYTDTDEVDLNSNTSSSSFEELDPSANSDIAIDGNVVPTPTGIAQTTSVPQLTQSFGSETRQLPDTQKPPCRTQFAQTTHSRLQQVPFSIAANIEKQAIWGTQNQLLAQSQSQFDGIIKKINREPGTKPLLHMTWQQVMLPRHRAKAVRLYAGKDLSNSFNLDGTVVNHDQQDLYSQFGFLQDYFAPKNDMPVWKVDGLFNIYLNHYLYVETQLNYRSEGIKHADLASIENGLEGPQQELNLELVEIQDNIIAEGAAQEQPFLYAIPMVQNRRVRSSEVHYLDHPKLGIVFQIRKMPQPEEHVQPIEVQKVEAAQITAVSE